MPAAPAPVNEGIGIGQGTAMTVGAVLGTGVLSLPALASQIAGPASLIAWLGLVLLSIPLASTFAGLGSRHPDGGGVATYARLAFGPRMATVVGWLFYFGVPVGATPAAGFAAAYVADLVGGGRPVQIAVTAVLVAVVIGMNWFGIRISGAAQLAIAGTLAVLLAVATAVSLPHADPANLSPFVPHGWAAVGTAASLLVWAFAGWEAVASLSAEYRRPERQIPRVTAITLAVIGVLYLGVAFAVVSVLGARVSPAPLSDLLEFGFGPAARPITAVVAVLLSLGAMNAYIASVARLGAALGRDGSLPGWFAVTHDGEPRHSLAIVAALAFGVIAALGATGLPIETGVLYVTGAFSFVYVVATAAAVKLLPRGRPVWLGALISLVGTAVLTLLSGWHLLPAALVAVAALGYASRRRA